MRGRNLLPVVVVVVAACGTNGGGDPAPTTDASSDSTSAVDAAAIDAGVAAPEDSGACSGPIANSGATIHEIAVASGPPAPGGGTVRDGLYFLTKWSVYTGTSGQSGAQSRTMQFTVRVAGTTWEFAIRDNGGTLDYGTQSVTYAGTTYAANLYCPPPAEMKGATDYSATANELHIFDSTLDSAGLSELVLMRQ